MAVLAILALVVGAIYLSYLMTKGSSNDRDGPGDQGDADGGG